MGFYFLLELGNLENPTSQIKKKIVLDNLLSDNSLVACRGIRTWDQKHYFAWGNFKACEVRLNQTLENVEQLKIPVHLEGTILDTAITRNHKNGYYGFTIEDGHLQQQPNTIKFG